MRDVNGNADTTQPAAEASCLPCPVSRHALCHGISRLHASLERLQAGPLADCSPSPRCLLQVNTYQPNTGQASCIACAAGTSTQGDGNTECQACALGYYSPVPEVGCLAAPPGTFVNITGATSFTTW